MRETPDLLDIATEMARSYVREVRGRTVGPSSADLARLASFAAVDLDAPLGDRAALELLTSAGSPATMRSTGGRYFGFVNGGVTTEALAASIIAGAWDQNVALPAMSPAAAAIDEAAAELLIDILGLPATATAAFCAGATVANITAIVAARDRLLANAGWSVHDNGLAGAPDIQVVIGEEAHISVHKALRIAGIGQRSITAVPADAWGRLDATQLPRPTGPTLVLLQAGNVNTGHSDPFDAVADHYEGADAWLHVDGAFGLWASAAPDRRQHVTGVERADSWATDGHKWLNVPYDCGVVICADETALFEAMRNDASYVPVNDGERTLMNLGLQMSQAARGVPVWTTLAARGRTQIAEMIEHTCRCAERFASKLEAAGVEVLAPVVINQALVAFGGDATTSAVVERVQRDGRCWMGATTWKNRTAMRISVSDFSTTFDDVDIAVETVLEAAEAVGTASGG